MRSETIIFLIIVLVLITIGFGVTLLDQQGQQNQENPYGQIESSGSLSDPIILRLEALS